MLDCFELFSFVSAVSSLIVLHISMQKCQRVWNAAPTLALVKLITAVVFRYGSYLCQRVMNLSSIIGLSNTLGA